MFHFSFLNASILVLAAASILPLIIHLLARKKPKTVVFSSLRFIKQSIHRQHRRLRLLEILLILIRTLVILFAVLAVARPVLKAPFLKSGAHHARTAVAIVLDNTYSMDYLVDTRTDLDIGKDEIKRINMLFTDNDMTVLLTQNRNWNRLNAHLQIGKIPDKTVQSVKITPNAEDLKSVLEEADRQLIESQLPNREIYLITDHQKQTLPDKTEAPIFVIATSNLDDKNNQSCQNASVVNDLLDPNGSRRVQFEVVNHSRTTHAEVICQLVIDDVAVADKVVDVEPGQRLTESFPVQFDAPGWHNGYVEVKNERHVFDNRSYFCTYFDPNPKVVVLTDTPALPLTLNALLGMYAGPAGSVRTMTNIPDLSELDDVSVIVVYKKAYDGRLRFLLDQLQHDDRGFLWIADRNQSQDWRDFASSSLGLELVQFHDGDKTPITSVNSYHPVTAMLDPNALRAATVTDYYTAKVSGGDAEVLLETAGTPLSVVRGHAVAWLFDPASLRSPFLLDPAFPVFGWRCLETVSAHAEETRKFTVGDRVILTGQKLTLPDGTPLETNLPAYTLAEPGIYTLETNNLRKPIAVNLNYAESEFVKFDPKQVKTVRWTTSNWLNEILLTRYGFETWKILLALVLLLLALEMLLVKRMEKSES